MDSGAIAKIKYSRLYVFIFLTVFESASQTSGQTPPLVRSLVKTSVGRCHSGESLCGLSGVRYGVALVSLSRDTSSLET